MIYFKLVNNYENGKLIMKSVNMVLLTGRKDLTMVLRVVKKKWSFLSLLVQFKQNLAFLEFTERLACKSQPTSCDFASFLL